MAFWDLESQPGDAPALLDANRQWSYSQLAQLADRYATRLPRHRRTLGFLGFSNGIQAVALYLGVLRSHRHVPLLLQPDMDPDLTAALAAHYRPDWLALPAHVAPPPGYEPIGGDDDDDGDAIALYAASIPDGDSPEVHADLALLLSTSGSTGSAKLVRLSYSNIDANAESISRYLGLDHRDRAITTLPLAYSFGLSILNSHLQAGGSIVLTDESPVGRGFWDLARERGITSLSGVPATYEMLRRVRIERFGLDRLRMLTQAGGRLRDALIEEFLGVSECLGLEFFVMYGQTEAAPRISYVPANNLRNKVGSVGVAVPGGELSNDADPGELVYRGPNVMLGYAESRLELAHGDIQGGILRTGDLARRDEDGYFYITGRTKRFVKISGNRVNLDEVESMLATALGRAVACAGTDDDLVVFVPGEPEQDQDPVRRLIQHRYRLFPGHVRVLPLDALPLMMTGKTDYAAMRGYAERSGGSA